MPRRMSRIASLWLIITGGVVVRALLPLSAWLASHDLAVYRSPDSASYIEPARELLRHGRFQTAAGPELVRTPAYPLFLVLGVATGRVELVTIALQVALGALSIYLVFRIASAVFDGARAPLLAAALYAAEPLSIVYTSKILSETVFTTLVLLFVACWVENFRRPSWRAITLAAMALAAAVYVRPVAYFLPIVATAMLAVRFALDRGRCWRQFLQIALFAGLSMGLVGLWQLRNWTLAGYARFSAVEDVNLYYYQYATVLARQQGRPFEEVRADLGFGDPQRYLSRHPRERTWTQAERYRAMRAEAWQSIRAKPAAHLAVYVGGLARSLADPGAAEYFRLFRRYPANGGLLTHALDRGFWNAVDRMRRLRPGLFWTNVMLGVALVCCFALAVLSLARRNGQHGAALISVVLVALYFVMLSGGPVGLSRFRHPVMPLVCVLAGSGLESVLQRLRGAEREERATAADLRNSNKTRVHCRTAGLKPAARLYC